MPLLGPRTHAALLENLLPTPALEEVQLFLYNGNLNLWMTPFSQMIPRVTWWEATGLQTVMVQLWLSAVTLRQFGKVCNLIYKRRLLISTDALMNANNHNAFFWKHWYQNVLLAAGCVLTTAPKMTL